MSRAGLSALVLCLTAFQPSGIALGETCRMAKIGELHVTVTPHNEILVDGSIKDQPAKFQIDTGAGTTLFDVSIFSRFGISNAGDQRRMQALGGEVGGVYRAVPGLKFGNFVGDNLHFTVSDNHFLREGVYALLGEDFLGSFDLDIDLAHETITLFEHSACSGEPVYWSQNFSEADLDIPNYRASGGAMFMMSKQILVKLELNGTPFMAAFDTGSSRTMMTTRLTDRMGIDENTTGMEQVGTSHGIDGRPLPVYKYRFAELHVGDEVIRNPVLHIVKSYALKADTRQVHGIDIDRDFRPDAYIGVDFIKTHHIYIDLGHRKMYFTYNGGGIFSPPQDNSVAAREDK